MKFLEKIEEKREGCPIKSAILTSLLITILLLYISPIFISTALVSVDMPDLIIQDITWTPSNPSIGDTVTFTVTIKNQGSGSSQGSYVYYYLDGSSYKLGSDSVSGLDAGATTTETFTWKAQAGSHTFKAEIDPGGSIAETVETNNKKTVTFSGSTLSDLIVQDITWTPSNPSIGDTVTFTVTIKNQGSGSSQGSYVYYYLDGSSYKLGSDSVSGLDAGATTTETFTWKAQAGSHTFKAEIDPGGSIAETVETNNKKTVTFSGSILSDLIVQDITWTPSNPSIGDTVTFTVTIKNQGSGSSQGSYVYYYLDGSSYKLGSDSVSGLDAGATTTETFTWKAQAGSHTFKAEIDPGGSIAETVETNNKKTVTFSGSTLSDLIVQDITGTPSNPSIGDTVTFTVTIKNQGSGSSQGSYVYYYLDGSSYKLDSDSVSGLDAGATTTETFTWKAQAGSHTFKAEIDPGGSIAETVETNNKKTVTFSGSTLSDLIVQDITGTPSNPSIGDTVTFTVTIKNQGSGSSQGSYVYYYLDGSSYKLDSDSVSGLDAGATTTETFTWKAQAGSHTFKAEIDPGGSIAETVETNNKKTVTFSGSTLSDLIVQDITGTPSNPSIGDTVTFTVTIKNQGSGSSQGSYVYYYLDGSSSRYDSDSVDGIDAGATTTETFTWSAKAGSHPIKAVIDPNENIAETDETNNEKTVTFSDTILSDLIVQDITWAPVSPSIGDTVTFTVTIRNQGSGSSRSSYVYYYLDGSSSRYDSDSVDGIDAGATTTETFTWSAKAGSQAIKAVIDPNENIAETDETNNEKTVTFSDTILSDLIVQDITWAPVSPSIGDTVTFTVTIRNQGSGSSRSSYVYYYLDGSSSRYDSDSVDGIDAGATTTETFTWSISRDVEGGEHTIRAVIDPKNEVLETNEDNNEKEVSFTITKVYTYADLTITVKDDRNSNILEDAEVYINDDRVGRTDSNGKITTKVAEGEKHTIKVTKLDYYSKIEIVSVGYDVGAKEVTIRLDYAKVPITIYVGDENRDEVRNAEVFLDGVSIGITDIEGEVTGDATKNKDVMVKVVKSGYYTEDALIHVGSYKERYSIKLKCEDLTTPNIVVEKMEIVGDNDDILEVGESVKITYSVKDDSGIKDIRCNLDGSLIDSYTTAGNYSTITPKLTIGKHIIEFEAIDADVNPHKSVKDVSITVSEKGPTVLFQSTKDTINMGENAVFTLGALNPIGRENMTVELILKAPSGVSVSGISFVKSGGGMYQATYEIEPGEGMKFITVDLIGNDLGTHKIDAEVHYSVLGGEVLTQHEMLTLTVIDASMKKKGKTPEQGSSGSTTPGFEAIFVIATLFAGVYLVRRKR